MLSEKSEEYAYISQCTHSKHFELAGM